MSETLEERLDRLVETAENWQRRSVALSLLETDGSATKAKLEKAMEGWVPPTREQLMESAATEIAAEIEQAKAQLLITQDALEKAPGSAEKLRASAEALLLSADGIAAEAQQQHDAALAALEDAESAVEELPEHLRQKVTAGQEAAASAGLAEVEVS